MAVGAGEVAPMLDQAFPDANGEAHVLRAALERGPAVIAIYKSSCAASKIMLPALNRIGAIDERVTLLGVSQDSANIARSFARRYEIDYPILVEGDGYPISIAFDIAATPTLYVIKQDGSVGYTTMGFFRPQLNEVAAAVASELGIAAQEVVAEDEPEMPIFVPG
jgi:peroxiredoxin